MLKKDLHAHVVIKITTDNDNIPSPKHLIVYFSDQKRLPMNGWRKSDVGDIYLTNATL